MLQLIPALILLFSLSSAQEPSANSLKLSGKNWVASPTLWHPATDDLGSKFDTTGGFFQDSSLNVTFTITPKTTSVWPFIELIFEAPVTFNGNQAIELVYKCDQDLVVKLFQEDFGPSPKGNDTYSLYQIKVPKSTEWKTIRLKFSDFSFPSWVPKKSKSIAMNLFKTKKLYLTPALDATLGGTSQLKVKSLQFIKD